MLVIPAVDIMDGKCVRLIQGDPDMSNIYSNSPIEVAGRLESQGAELIHLIDLDAALGSGQNTEAIESILTRTNVKVQVGGGIRSLEDAGNLLELGVFRVIFGTAAAENPSVIQESIRLYGSRRVAVAIDEIDGGIAYHGWKVRSSTDYLDYASFFEEIKVGTIIFTSIGVDGTLRGPQIGKVKKLVKKVHVPVIASGGIASLDDLISLVGTGVEGVIIGTALYEGRFTLKQAFEVVKNAG